MNTETSTKTNPFAQPMEVTIDTYVFSLMPKYEDIPKEFKSHSDKWNSAVSHWFFNGISKDAFTPKKDIDINKAFKHLGAIISSWSPKHEHKTAGAAYLMSLWFKDVKIKK